MSKTPGKLPKRLLMILPLKELAYRLATWSCDSGCLTMQHLEVLLSSGIMHFLILHLTQTPEQLKHLDILEYLYFFTCLIQRASVAPGHVH